MEALMTALAFSIPCAKRAVPTFIALVLITALVNAIRKRRVEIPLQVLPNIFLAGIFMLLVAGLTYSAHPDEGIIEIGIKLSFLIFPLLSFLLPTITREQYTRFTQAFISGCFAFLLITTCRAGWRSFETHDLYYMSYESLSWYVHPTYAATYQAMAVFMLAEMAMRNDFVFHRKKLHFLAMGSVFIFIAMLASKAGLIAAAIAIGAAVLVAKRKQIGNATIAIASVLAFSLLIATTLALPSSAKRISTAISDVNPHEETTTGTHKKEVSYSSTQLRLVTWSAAWQLMSTHPVGVGTGATESALKIIYTQQGETYAAKRNLNAHNQFFQLGAELGWPALVLLLACLIVLWQHGMSEHHALTMLFVALCAMNFLFESFLEVQAGIVFYSFWILLFTKTKTN